mmetsp:Transcript_16175/g.31630  ORF Transcript_16175/g.31630 Transcript_16175/m.31630 type:complete len:237 (+) Transcript_16175:267-977(+)
MVFVACVSWQCKRGCGQQETYLLRRGEALHMASTKSIRTHTGPVHNIGPGTLRGRRLQITKRPSVARWGGAFTATALPQGCLAAAPTTPLQKHSPEQVNLTLPHAPRRLDLDRGTYASDRLYFRRVVVHKDGLETLQAPLPQATGNEHLLGWPIRKLGAAHVALVGAGCTGRQLPIILGTAVCAANVRVDLREEMQHAKLVEALTHWTNKTSGTDETFHTCSCELAQEALQLCHSL